MLKLKMIFTDEHEFSRADHMTSLQTPAYVAAKRPRLSSRISHSDWSNVSTLLLFSCRHDPAYGNGGGWTGAADGEEKLRNQRLSPFCFRDTFYLTRSPEVKRRERSRRRIPGTFTGEFPIYLCVSDLCWCTLARS